MGWIWTILIGFLIGVLAKFLHPGKDNLGFIMTTLLGIIGLVSPGARRRFPRLRGGGISVAVDLR